MLLFNIRLTSGLMFVGRRRQMTGPSTITYQRYTRLRVHLHNTLNPVLTVALVMNAKYEKFTKTRDEFICSYLGEFKLGHKAVLPLLWTHSDNDVLICNSIFYYLIILNSFRTAFFAPEERNGRLNRFHRRSLLPLSIRWCVLCTFTTAVVVVK